MARRDAKGRFVSVGGGTKNRIPEYTKKIIRGLERGLDAAAWFLVGDIIRGIGKGDAPKVKTARLIQSITMVRAGRLSRFIGSSIQPRSGQPASYPLYQELGFTHWKTGKKIIHPWLRPALDRSKVTMMRFIASGR